MEMSQAIIIAIVVGLIIGLIVTGVLRASLKSVHMQKNAAYYEKAEGLTLTRKSDIYLYKHVDKIAKPKDNKK